MKKRLFQTLDEMNVNDINNKTQTVVVFNQVVGGNMNKNNAKLTIGLDSESFQNIIIKKTHIPILLVIDSEEYEKLKSAIQK